LPKTDQGKEEAYQMIVLGGLSVELNSNWRISKRILR